MRTTTIRKPMRRIVAPAAAMALVLGLPATFAATVNATEDTRVTLGPAECSTVRVTNNMAQETVSGVVYTGDVDVTRFAELGPGASLDLAVEDVFFYDFDEAELFATWSGDEGSSGTTPDVLIDKCTDPAPETPGNGDAPAHAGMTGRPDFAGQPGMPPHARGGGNRR